MAIISTGVQRFVAFVIYFARTNLSFSEHHFVIKGVVSHLVFRRCTCSPIEGTVYSAFWEGCSFARLSSVRLSKYISESGICFTAKRIVSVKAMMCSLMAKRRNHRSGETRRRVKVNGQWREARVVDFVQPANALDKTPELFLTNHGDLVVSCGQLIMRKVSGDSRLDYR